MMENAVGMLISIDEQASQGGLDLSSKNFAECLAQVSEVFSKGNRGQLEAIYKSLSSHPPSNYFFLWLSLLEAESESEVDLPAFARRVQQFVTVCKKDFIKYVPRKFNTIMKNFTEKHVAARKPMAAIRALKVALNKMAPTQEHITPIHAYLTQVCLLAKNYKAPQAVLERDIVEVDPIHTDVQPLDALLYFYYGGMIYIGLKKFRKAQDFFTLAISAPAYSLSAVMIECFKKFVLVSLILDGQVGALPKYTTSFVSRQLKVLNAPYLEFAKAFQTHKQIELHEAFQKFLPIFQKDKNEGLALQAFESLYKRNILRLTQTYVTLSLADIASSVKLPGPNEAEAYVLRMIEDGEIHARINEKDSMVSFLGNPEQYKTNAMMIHLDSQLKNTTSLGNRIDALQRQISRSPQYLVKVLQSEKGATGYEEVEFDGPAERHHAGVQLQ